MVLYTEDGSVAERDAFKCAVEERHMCHLDIIRQRIGHDDESVVLTGNLDLAGLHVFNRMIGTSVAVMHFLSRRTQSQRQHLMAEADSEDRQPRFENRFDHRHGVFAGRGGITWPVREKDSIRFVPEYVFRRRIGRHHRHLTAKVGKAAQNIALGAEIDGDDVKFRIGLFAVPLAKHPIGFIPGIGLATTYILGEIHPF